MKCILSIPIAVLFLGTHLSHAAATAPEVSSAREQLSAAGFRELPSDQSALRFVHESPRRAELVLVPDGPGKGVLLIRAAHADGRGGTRMLETSVPYDSAAALSERLLALVASLREPMRPAAAPPACPFARLLGALRGRERSGSSEMYPRRRRPLALGGSKEMLETAAGKGLLERLWQGVLRPAPAAAP